MLALIVARGGSKGLPNKNIKLLNNKPLIAYTIEAAQKSKYIDKIILSTDCHQIAKIAQKYGAIVPFMRPESLATDDSPVIETFIYTIDKLNNEFGYKISEFVLLQPTSPLRTSEDIDNAIELFYNKNADSVISYTPEHHPIFWHKFINDDYTFEDIFQNTQTNRQNIKKTFYPNGAIYVFKYSLICQKKYYSEKSFAYIMPRNRSVDIDTIEDFEYAEFLILKNLKNEY